MKIAIIGGVVLAAAGIGYLVLSKKNQTVMPSTGANSGGSSGGASSGGSSGSGSFNVTDLTKQVTSTTQQVATAAKQVTSLIPTASSGPASQYEGKLVRGPNNAGKVYLVKNGIKQWISSPAVLTGMGFTWDQVIDITRGVLDSIPEGAAIYGFSGLGSLSYKLR